METMMIGGGFGGLFWLIILGLVIWLIVDRRPTPGAGGSRHTNERSAIDILNAAYAHGELDRETYLQKKGDISG